MAATLTSIIYESPVGPLTLIADDQSLVAVLWPNDRPDRVRLEHAAVSAPSPILITTASQLDEYFEGKRRSFDIALAPRGTEFQLQVWQRLIEIPYGETCTYGELATQVGRAGAARAVGSANGRNPISIVVPCHRVIGTDGSLAGFAGGLATKQELLELERQAG